MVYKNKKSEEYHKKYREDNKEILKQKRKDELILKPWRNSYFNAKQRCNNENHPDYYRYGERGIKFLLSQEEIKHIWERDKAHLLIQASIDRINNDGDYKLSNCQFIEMDENTIKNKRKTIYQYDRQGNFINEYISQCEASRQTNIQQSDINKCANDVLRTAGGFIWKHNKKESKIDVK
jgi:hypothetical protein